MSMTPREAATCALCEATELLMTKALTHPDIDPYSVMTALLANATIFQARFGGTREDMIESLKQMPLCPEEEAAQQVMGELGMIVMAFGGGDPDREDDGTVIKFPSKH